MAYDACRISGRVLQVSDGGAIREDWDMNLCRFNCSPEPPRNYPGHNNPAR